MKKMVAFLLVFLMLFGSASTVLAQDTTDLSWNLENSIFPLEEPVTFTVLSSGYRHGTLSDIGDNEDWKSFCEATNLNFNFVSIGDYDAPEARNNLQLKIMNEDFGDAIMTFYINTLSTADIQELGTAGVLLPLEEYMGNPEIMPNFYENIYSKYPHLINNMKSADGHIYAFQGVNESAAFTSGEGLLQVNEAWLEAWKIARGVEHSPETLDEFEDMLTFFRDADLNGNGTADEIPYMIAQACWNGTISLEHAMGMYGIATKDSALDMNIMIDDNKCYFAHTTEKYKAALKTFADWYSKGLIWSEIFTGNAETINSEMAIASSKIGVLNTNNTIDGFIGLMPPKIDGYSPRYHMHPAMRAGLDQPFLVVTKECKNPEIIAAFVDLQFDYANHMLWRFGSENFKNGKITRDESGRYVFGMELMYSPEKGEVDDAKRSIYDYLWYIISDTLEMFNAKVDIDAYYGDDASVAAHKIFIENNLWNPTDCIWPRCALLDEDAEDFAFYYTDVSAVLTEYRAKFITGQLDIDAEWDNFQNKMQKLGINEMQEMIQRAYDAYLSK